MVKRKADGEYKQPSKTEMDIDGEEDESEDDTDMLDVDFEWFDLEPKFDFHGLKTLLRQLLDVDNQLIELSELSDLLLSQPRLGSTVKCEGEESDPYAFISVLNIQQHREKKCVQQLRDYILSKASGAHGLEKLEGLLAPDSKANVGLILSERFVNMPHQVVPLLYSVLAEEVDKHVAFKELPGPFTHYVILSKTYVEVESKLDVEDKPPQQKRKKNQQPAAETFYFHPEDEELHKHGLAHASFGYTNQGDEGASDSRRTFQEAGVKAQGHLILLESGKLKGAVEGVAKYLGTES